MKAFNEVWQWIALGAVGVYVLSRAGGPVWEALKKIAYRVWEDVKSLVFKAKFW